MENSSFKSVVSSCRHTSKIANRLTLTVEKANINKKIDYYNCNCDLLELWTHFGKGKFRDTSKVAVRESVSFLCVKRLKVETELQRGSWWSESCTSHHATVELDI